MRVLLFTDADVFAGTERHIFDLASSLACSSSAASIACPEPSPLAARAREAGIDVVPVPKRGLVDREASKLLARLLRSNEIDLIHAHNGRTALIAAMATASARARRLVTTQHFLEPSRLSRRGVKGILSGIAHRWVGGRIAHRVAISDAVRDAMLARGEADPAGVTVVRNGIPDPDRNSLKPRDQLRAELGLPAEAPLVACAARLEAEKDVGTLVDAMGRVLESVLAAHCVIAGQGEQREALRQRIAALGIARSVSLLGFRSDVHSVIDAADVFVLPAPAEPFGLVIAEAMALGKPVIATRAGGPREIVVEGITGRLIPPSDPAALAAALAEILTDPAKRRQMGQAGRARYLEHFTSRRMAAEMLAVYERVLQAN